MITRIVPVPIAHDVSGEGVPRARSRSAVVCVALALSLGLFGCPAGGVTDDDETVALCAQPQTGSKYAVCGHLTTGPFGGPSEMGREAKGSVDSVAESASSKYKVFGGSFHASH